MRALETLKQVQKPCERTAVKKKKRKKSISSEPMLAFTRHAFRDVSLRLAL